MKLSTTLTRHRALLLILLGYIVLAFAYSVVNPMFESPDEEHHITYVRHLVERHTLPVMSLNEMPSEKFQPPLYYALNALLTAAIDADDLYLRLERHNPYWGYAIGEVGRDNKNKFLHDSAERFPYTGSGAALAVHLMRWLTLLWTGATVVATYLLGRELFPDQPAIALGATAFVAFVPQFLFTAGSVSNDGPTFALLSWIFYTLLREVRTGLSLRQTVAEGLLLGLALLTKMTAMIAVPIIVLVGLIQLRQGYTWSAVLKHKSLIAAIALVMTGWWFARNLALYGEPTGLQRHQLLRGSLKEPEALGVFDLTHLHNIISSYWARFGWGQIPVDDAIYQALNLVMLAALGGLLIFCYRRWRAGRLDPLLGQRLALMAIWVAIGFASMASFASRIDASDLGRYMFPVIPAIALFTFLGLAQYFPPGLHRGLALAAHLLMAGLAAICLLFYLGPAYARPPILSAGQLGAISHPLSVRYEDKIALLGYDLEREQVRPGEALSLTLYWKALAPMERDYSVFVQLFGRGGQSIGQRDSYPGLGNYPTSQWQPGQIVVDAYKVPVSGEAAAPSRVRIDAGFYELDTMERLPARTDGGQSGAYTIGYLKLPPPAARYDIEHPASFVLGERVELNGYDIAPAVARPGGVLKVTLYWRARQTIAEDYTTFIHLVDSQGNIQAQADSQPLGGDYPTSLWGAGELIRDEPELALPESTPPGHYRLMVGMYLLDTGQRLPVSGDRAQVQNDAVILAEVVVGE
jgi:4-amino-4-deoxy-L-arabinose transferase-like glycosyltransferase